MSLEKIDRSEEAGEHLGFRVEGMDCASCVGKIETALGRLDGLSDVQVNFASETLILRYHRVVRRSARLAQLRSSPSGGGIRPERGPAGMENTNATVEKKMAGTQIQ